MIKTVGEGLKCQIRSPFERVDLNHAFHGIMKWLFICCGNPTTYNQYFHGASLPMDLSFVEPKLFAIISTHEHHSPNLPASIGYYRLFGVPGKSIESLFPVFAECKFALNSQTIQLFRHLRSGRSNSYLAFLFQSEHQCLSCTLVSALFSGNFFLIKDRTKLPELFEFNLPKDKIELLLFGLISFIVINHFYRSLVPWWDEDEIHLYGLFTKLVASGWSNPDFSRFHPSDPFVVSPRLVELISSVFYKMSSSTLLPRLFRLICFIALSRLLYSFLRTIGSSKKISLLLVLLFTGTPEFSYLTTSLKVDSLVLCFEFTSLLLILITFLKGKELGDDQIANLSLMAVLSANLSFLSRYSSVYILLISIGVFVFHCLKRKNSFSMKKSLGFAVLCCFISFFYFRSVYLYGNPFFPFNSPWPFHNGKFLIHLDEWRGYYNLNWDVNPILKGLYLIFHTGMSLETTFYDSFKFIPHAKVKGNSLGWLNPTIMLFVISPAFFKNSRIRLVSLLFFVLYVFWLNGVTYTRVFIAPSSLAILLCGFLYEHVSFKKVFLGLISLICCFQILYQSMYTLKKYHHSFLSHFSKTHEFKSNSLRFLPPFTLEESNKIDNLINEKSTVLTDYGRIGKNLNIFFRKGLWLGEGINEINVKKAGCIFYNKLNFHIISKNQINLPSSSRTNLIY